MVVAGAVLVHSGEMIAVIVGAGDTVAVPEGKRAEGSFHAAIVRRAQPFRSQPVLVLEVGDRGRVELDRSSSPVGLPLELGSGDVPRRGSLPARVKNVFRACPARIDAHPLIESVIGVFRRAAAVHLAGGPGATPYVPPRPWLPQVPRFWASGRARHSPGLLLAPQMLRQVSFTARIERWSSRGTRSKQSLIPHSVRDDNGPPGFGIYDRLTGKRVEQPQMFRLRFAPLNMTVQLFWLRLAYQDICTTASWRSLRRT